MYIYFIIFLIIFSSSFIFRKDELNNNIILRRNYCIGVTIVLILLSGLRHESIGLDTPMYKLIWETINESSNSIIETDAELGFYYLMKYLKHYIGYQGFLLVVALFSIVPVSFIIYKYSRNVIISFLLFYSSISFHVLEFAAERQAIAFGIIMIAFHFIMKRKLIYYLICIGVAFFFHRSCVIFLPSYWLYNLRLDNNTIKYWGVVLAVSFVFSRGLFLFLNSFWRMEYGLYEEGAGGERFFALLCLIVIIGLNQPGKINNYETIRVPLIVFAISPLLWPILNTNPALYRLQYYFDFFIALYIPNFLSVLEKNNKWRYLLITISGFMMLYIVFVMRTTNAYYPYKFFWE